MKKILIALVFLLIAGAAFGGWWWYQNDPQPMTLASDEDLFVSPNPESDQDQATINMLMPAGPKLDGLLQQQVMEPLIEEDAKGKWVGLLAEKVWLSRNGRRWRFQLRPLLHDGEAGGALKADGMVAKLKPKGGASYTVIDPLTFEMKLEQAFSKPIEGLAMLTGRFPTGPFNFGEIESLQSSTPNAPPSKGLLRHEVFRHGKAGIAGVRVENDPALMESRAWADGLFSRRWDIAIFPGTVSPSDMSRVRQAPYDEIRMKDGSVWFVSRRLRRLRPVKEDWTRTRFFGIWRGGMDLSIQDPN
jgi:hypothetical protein